MDGYIIALDQGTTSSRAVVFDKNGGIVTLAQYPFRQYYPRPGWVEHDPMEILDTQLRALDEAFEKSGLSPTDIAGIGQLLEAVKPVQVLMVIGTFVAAQKFKVGAIKLILIMGVLGAFLCKGELL